MNPEDRLDKLECELSHIKRRYRRLLGGVLIIAVVAVVLIGKLLADSTQSIVIAEKVFTRDFALLDPQNNIRVILNSSEGGPALSLIDAQGQIRVKLGLTKGGPFLALIDAQGKNRAELSLTEGEPALALLDAQGKFRAILSLIEERSALALLDAQGKGHALLSVIEGKPEIYSKSTFKLVDPDGKTLSWAP